MSRYGSRSGQSQSHQSRISRNRVSDDELFNYVLRVALLGYLILPKLAAAPAAPTGDVKDPGHYSRFSGAITNSLSTVTDLVRAEQGSKSLKFPKELVNALEAKVKSIATGMGNQDPAYTDMLFRRTMATYYGSVMNDQFKKTMKENRKIEEIILTFATHATKTLSKDPTLPGDSWKAELNKEISLFVRVLADSLRTLRFVPAELTARLDMYMAKLAPPRGSDSGYDTASTSNQHARETSVSSGISENVGDMKLVKTVAHLFKISLANAQREVDSLRKYCTDKAAVNDLKTCLKNINSGESFPGKRDDFCSDQAWQHWRTLEMAHLSQLMLIMAQLNPSLARSTPSDVLAASPTSARSGASYSSPHAPVKRHNSAGSQSTFSTYNFMDQEAAGDEIRQDDEVPVGHHFVYIPPNPKKFYKRLLELCLIADLARMMSPEVDDNDEVSLGILSPPHIELLNECALRWRIGQPYRTACFLDLVKQFYERSEVPLECIPEALQNIAKITHENHISMWPVQDAEYLASVYGSLFSVFVSALYHAMDGIPQLKEVEVEPFVVIIETVRDSGILGQFELDISARLADVEERVKVVAADWHDRTLQDLQSAPGVNRALPLLLMTDEMEKYAKLLDKHFPEPLIGQIDLTALFVEVVIPAYILNVEKAQKRLYDSSMNGPTPDVPIQDLFSLYRRTKFLIGMYTSFVPSGRLTFEIGVFFEPYVRQWLKVTDGKTAQWVEAAVAADKFKAEDNRGNSHSSSIVDLFDSLRSPITFLHDLDWDNKYQKARFFTSLAKSISQAMDQYCRTIEELFMIEMFPRPNEHLQPQKPSAWLEKAKQLAAVNNKKLIEPFNFLPESCVKLNNVESARRLLDGMYNQMEADKLQEIIENHGPAVPEKIERPSFLFTVKIIIAEGLVPLDSSPSSLLDTFVTLSDEGGHRMAKTRTIYDTLSPRWDETFDVSVDKPLWLMVSIRDRALVGKHDTVGRAYLCLDPKRFGDFLTHDLWMDLDTSGRIMLRVSMEGEKDDIQFYFGRAFRSLKRAEADMVRIFIDKMAPVIQQSLSRNVLKSLLKTGSGAGTGLDYNKALGNMTAFLRGSQSESQVSLPAGERVRGRPEDLTDVDVEEAIAPLFDYFDDNLQTLNTHLSEEATEKVMTRVWKEILTVIEGLLIPPLSDISSDMKPLTEKEVDIAFKWLKFMREYFYAGGDGPVSLELLQNQKYRDILSIRLYYDWHTDALMEECVRMMRETLRGAPTIKKRAKSVKSQRNLGTIKERKKEKREEKESSNGETILRILRIRPGTSDFIAQQLQIMAAMKVEQEQRLKAKQNGLSQRSQLQSVPEVPALNIAGKR